MDKCIKINPKDTVALALKELKIGETALGIILLDDIEPSHKFALSDILCCEDIIKYGYSIGKAKVDIKVGEFVHTHNLETRLSGSLEYEYNPSIEELKPCENIPTFMGYQRADGNVGIRNELWIVPTVGCVNGPSQRIKEKFLIMTQGLGIDDIKVLSHDYGCSQVGDDLEYTRDILVSTINNPNAGGVLVLGLGCENNNIVEFKEALGDYDENRIKLVNAQDVEDEVETGLNALLELYNSIKYQKRTQLPISKLVIGLKCGGSDGLSGVSANPMVGVFSDYIISCGGSTILTEVPEMFGAEQILMDRCINRNVFDKTVDLINSFKEYFISHGESVADNPSYGNKKGGITTLEEKSLGCTQKGGKAPVVDVIQYAQRVKVQGLSLLQSPGNDLVASTALAAAGSHMVLFTTGRGTPFATYIPTVKISTNSPLYNKKTNWMDFNCGELVNGAKMEKVVDEFIQEIIAIASGKETKSEALGYGGFTIFKDGVTE